LHEKIGPGPAIIEVTRDGKRMKICSRCDLFGDEEKKVLLDLDVEALLAFDAFGAKALLPELLGLPSVVELLEATFDILNSLGEKEEEEEE